jgi:hypothetical protein
LITGFIFTPFGNDPSGRYFLPFTVVFSIIAAEMIEKRIKQTRWQVLVTGILVLYQLGGVFQCASINPPGINTQFDTLTVIDHRYDKELIDFLEQKQEKVGYTNYWVAYPLAFQSNERLIFIPSLPYHQDLRYTARDNRYLPYSKLVESANRAAYIVTNNPLLVDKLRNGFDAKKASWNEEKIGDYLIFYQLSKLVRPSDIGL